jgi:hypothetical protein
MFFVKPVVALAGVWLIFKLLISKSIQATAPGGQSVDWLGFGYVLLALLALWLVANAIDWLCRRIWPA